VNVEVNGEARDVADDATVGDVVRALVTDPGRPGVAVAVDGEIVPSRAWDHTTLTHGARVEVVAAVQGG
jgi:sulfur carrier protein